MSAHRQQADEGRSPNPPHREHSADDHQEDDDIPALDGYSIAHGGHVQVVEDTERSHPPLWVVTAATGRCLGIPHAHRQVVGPSLTVHIDDFLWDSCAAGGVVVDNWSTAVCHAHAASVVDCGPDESADLGGGHCSCCRAAGTDLGTGTRLSLHRQHP